MSNTQPSERTTLNNGNFEQVLLKSAVAKDTIDITELVSEINIFQSIQVPFITGNILIVDAIGLLNSLFIIGNELITVRYMTLGLDGKRISQQISFFVTSIDKIEKESNNTVYGLTLGSLHFVANSSTKISQAYTGSSSDIIKNIFENQLKLNEEDYYIEKTPDSLKVIIPNLSIAETLMFITRRAQGENGTPCFVFEYLDGSMGFASLEKLYSAGSMFKYYRRTLRTTDPVTTYFDINDLTIDKIGNGYTNITNGMYAAKVYAFDPLTRQVLEHDFNLSKAEKSPGNAILNDIPFSSGVTINSKPLNELHKSKIFTVITSSDGSNNKKPEITGVYDGKYDYHTNSEIKVPYLNSKFLQLENFVMTINIQGNINIGPGSLISLVMPSASTSTKDGDALYDKNFSGEYLVINVRQTFTAQSHYTTVQLAKDSFRI